MFSCGDSIIAVRIEWERRRDGLRACVHDTVRVSNVVLYCIKQGWITPIYNYSNNRLTIFKYHLLEKEKIGWMWGERGCAEW